MRSLIFFLIFNLISLVGIPQGADTCEITHELNPCEARLKERYNRDFVTTQPPLAPVRMVAEFEPMQSVLVRYPFGIPASLVAEITEDCNVTTIVEDAGEEASVLSIYLGAGVDTSRCDFIYAQSNSYWTRDYGPWFVIDGNLNMGVCDFPYNRPRPYDDEIPVVVADHLNIDLYGMPLEHTGGNWMCDGISNGASTDLVWEENPGLSHDSVSALTEAYLGISNYHVLADPLGEYIKHIDCWGKFLDVDKVLIGEVPPGDSRYDDFEYVADYFAQTLSAWGNYYQVYRVFTPGEYQKTPYTNSLILNKKVFVPLTGSTHDAAAMQVYEDAMPGYEIIGITYSGWFNTDALHCRTKGIADTAMLYIKHLPLLGYHDFEESWKISAEIISMSSLGLYPDSLWVSYMVDSSNYQQITMVNDSGLNFSAEIPFQMPGSDIAYYIHAADSTGRVSEHPHIGQPDPHTFKVDSAVCVWTGDVSQEWGDTLNWYNYYAPGLQDKVFIIDDCDHFPVISGNLIIGDGPGPTGCDELVLRSGSSITVLDSLLLSSDGLLRVDSGAVLNVGEVSPPR